MHYPDYSEFHEDMQEDVEEVRERLSELAPYMLLNRFLAMDLHKMPHIHTSFAHIGPLVKKLTLKDFIHTPKFNERVGKEAGRLLLEYCSNGTFQDRDLKICFSDDNRAKVFELAKYLTNLKTLDCYKVRDKWGNFSVQQITQYCPKLERLIVVADFIDCEDFNIDLITPQHSTLKKIKINLQIYSHSGIESIIVKIGENIKEKSPNVAFIEVDVEIDAYNEDWTYEQEAEFLAQFHENHDMYCHFKEMQKLKRCKLSYLYLYEGVATLEVNVK